MAGRNHRTGKERRSRKFDLSQLPPAPDLSFESALWQAGILRVAGIDEAGRGALAGPVCAAALILPVQPNLQAALCGVRDSKQMTPAAREHWAVCLRQIALAYGVGFASAQEIDEIGIAPATRLAIQRALQEMALTPEHLLVDYLELPEIHLPQTPLVKGDARALSIAGASVLAKTARDALMRQLDEQYPGYGLAVHKGYGTQAHRQALARLGPSAIHRRSFQFHE
jgi:ribonuclease HII